MSTDHVLTSGNPIPFPLNPTAQACYNLVYLELAGCRLTALPTNFSAIVPNVRTLNLNYNFLETADVAKGLAGLTRLKKLTIVGGRMTSTGELIRLLNSIGSCIELLDFRYVLSRLYVSFSIPMFPRDTARLIALRVSEDVRYRTRPLVGRVIAERGDWVLGEVRKRFSI